MPLVALRYAGAYKNDAEDHEDATRGVYPYLPMATNAPWSFFLGGGVGVGVVSIKSLILSFNIQKCEFCAQI